MNAASRQSEQALATIRGLTVVSRPEGRRLLDQVSLSLRPGEIVGLVGESGAGKSLTALALMGLLEGVRVVEGQVWFRGRALAGLSPVQLRQLRGRRIGLVFQEPSMALDPLMTIGSQIEELFRQHEGLSGPQARPKVTPLLERVGIEDPPRIAGSYPHQLSGGQRQRCLIALADALEPDLLIADEPTASLDPGLQAQILSLLGRLGRGSTRALLLISHDLRHVTALADRIIVLRAGRVVEEAASGELIRAPKHDYTRQLVEASGARSC